MMIHPISQEAKLKIIEQLIILNDDAVFAQIEDLMSKAMHRPSYKKLSKSEVVSRAKQANEDIDNNRVFSQAEVEKLTQSWNC